MPQSIVKQLLRKLAAEIQNKLEPVNAPDMGDAVDLKTVNMYDVQASACDVTITAYDTLEAIVIHVGIRSLLLALLEIQNQRSSDTLGGL